MFKWILFTFLKEDTDTGWSGVFYTFPWLQWHRCWVKMTNSWGNNETFNQPASVQAAVTEQGGRSRYVAAPWWEELRFRDALVVFSRMNWQKRPRSARFVVSHLTPPMLFCWQTMWTVTTRLTDLFCSDKCVLKCVFLIKLTSIFITTCHPIKSTHDSMRNFNPCWVH